MAEKSASKIAGLELFSVDSQGLLEHRLAYGRARGKLLLFGEHSALYGSHALGVSLDQACEVFWSEGRNTALPPEFTSLTQSTEQKPARQPRRLKTRQTWDLGLLAKEVQKEANLLLKNLPVLLRIPAAKIPQGVLFVQSNVPESGGFGSSAALSAALVLALKSLGSSLGKELNLEAWSAANAIDSFFHGKASGIDTGLALRQGIWDFVPRKIERRGLRFSAKILSQKPGLFLLYAGLGRSTDTKTLVSAVRKKVEADDKTTKTALAQLSSFCLKARRLLTKAAKAQDDKLVLELGKLSKKAQTQLRALELSNAELDAVLAYLEAEGSPGAKLSGGGGGGAFYAWAINKAQAEELAVKLLDFAEQQGIRLVAEPKVLELS